MQLKKDDINEDLSLLLQKVGWAWVGGLECVWERMCGLGTAGPRVTGSGVCQQLWESDVTSPNSSRAVLDARLPPRDSSSRFSPVMPIDYLFCRTSAGMNFFDCGLLPIVKP